MVAPAPRLARGSAVSPPAVSAVIPTWNRADLVVRAVRSALGQQMADLEVIVVDDGSTDHTRAAVEAMGDPRVTVLALPRRVGSGAARNHGIRAARAELVAFLDSDDEWRPTALAAMRARLDGAGDQRATVVYCRLEVRDERSGRTVPPGPDDLAAPEGDVLDHLLAGWQPRSASAVAVRRAALLEAGGFDESLPAWVDMDLWLRLARAGHRFVAVPEPLGVKHEHAGPQVMTDPARQAAALAAFEAKWRAAWDGRPAAYRRWRVKRAGEIQYAHFVQMGRALGAGERAAAWRHWAALCAERPPAPRLAAQGLLLGVLGPHGYARLRSAWRTARGAPRG